MLTDWTKCERCARAIQDDDWSPRRYVEVSYFAGDIQRIDKRRVCKECYREILSVLQACDHFRDATKMVDGGDGNG